MSDADLMTLGSLLRWAMFITLIANLVQFFLYRSARKKYIKARAGLAEIIRRYESRMAQVVVVDTPSAKTEKGKNGKEAQ